MYYFDPSFGYIHTTDTGNVRYGRGPVVPHDPTSITDQRYTRFEGWVPIEPHNVPDEWLLGFWNEQETIVIIETLRWGWREWTVLIPIWCAIGYVLWHTLSTVYVNP